MSTPAALSGIRVLDLTQNTAGPYCTKLMAGLGADVIKVEPPSGGDPTRGLAPFFGDPEGPQRLEKSIRFVWLNTGKKSLRLDLETPAGREAAKRLAAEADVVIESFKPGAIARMGLDYRSLAESNPRLVMTSISGFGQSGPYRDHEAEEIQIYALSGLMHETGDPDRAPLASGPPLASCTAGLSAFFATIAALYLRERTGRGQWVDVSAQEASLINIEMSLVNCLQLGQVKKRAGDRHVMVPWEMYDCADGEAAIVGGPIRNWRRAAEFLPEPRLFEKRFDYVKDRMAQRQEFESLLRPVVKKLDKRHLFHEAQKRNLGFSYLVSLDEALTLPQHLERGLFVELEHPVAGRHRYVGAPFRMSKTPWIDRRAPLLGEHDGGSWASRAAETPPSPPESAEPVLPFEGLRVLDFTHEWAGPIGTRLLADLGAEVIRVEYPKRLCVVRGARTDDRHYDKHPMWHQVNRNKLSVTMDLAIPEQVSAFKDLAATSDLVVNNSRAGVMERHGLGYENLREVRPDLVFAALSGFGATGPFARYAAFGGTIEPISGLLQLTGYEREGRRYRIREMDVVNGLVGACAVVTALLHRKRTGEGQFVDVSQTEAATHALMGEALLEATMTGSQTLPLGNRSAHFAPQGCYRCRGEDRWVTITVRNDDEWKRFCRVVRPSWADDERFRCTAGRVRYHDEIDQGIESWTRERGNAEVMATLQAAGIPAGAVLDTRALASDPHLLARGYFIRAESGSEGLFPGMFFRLSEGSGRLRRRGPDLGEHNRYVYETLLGWPAGNVPAIREEEVGTGYDPA